MTQAYMDLLIILAVLTTGIAGIAVGDYRGYRRAIREVRKGMARVDEDEALRAAVQEEKYLDEALAMQAEAREQRGELDMEQALEDARA